ncbi:MAG: hypothetical protein GC193_05925 [Cryomorphaceae bacterium]|nr:hypothetical protein [Cryomorphaceae bacterium]
MEMQSVYSGFLGRNNEELTRLQSLRRNIVIARVLLFLVFSTCVYFAFSNDIFWLWGAAPLVVAFLFFVRKAGEVENGLQQARALEVCIKNELGALKGQQVDWRVEAPLEAHAWVHDLDVFGAQSLFGVVNRSHDVLGKRWLANEMLTAGGSRDVLISRNAAVEAMSMNHAWRLNLQAASLLQVASEKDVSRFKEWLNESDAIPNVGWLLKIAPVYGLFGVVLSFAEVVSSQLLLLYWLVPLSITGAFLPRVNRVATALGKQVEMLNSFSLLFHRACSADDAIFASSSAFNTLKNGVSAMKTLAKISSDTDQRNNVFAAIVTNALYLADLRNAHRASVWRRKFRNEAEQWFDALSEVEGLMSIACFRANFRDETTWARHSDGVEVIIEGGGHPLMLSKNQVRNDFSISKKEPVIILTGANMAGKSTYLRMVGVNVLLAKIGAPVVAVSAVIGDVRLFSSMRTRDSLQSGKSYFFAELERLVHLLEEVKRAPNTLVLLDEILKGTNSKDKEAGSKAFVMKLAKQQVLTLVATHDTSLCELENDVSGVTNNHFASYIKNDDLSFDYTLQTGVCKTMNATWLMQHMGIIDKV